MPLFEPSAAPIGERPKRYGESLYAYYRDSERQGIVAIRALLEGWFVELPEDERLDLQQRFRSPIERQHRSALFELFLHQLLIRCGFEIEFHPDIPGIATHPDFLVSRDGQQIFYLEAIAVGNSTREEAEANRMNQVYDALNNLVSPDFYLGLRVEGAPETPPPGARLRGELGRWLVTLDRQAIQQCFLEERYGDVPTYEWAHDGWRIVFEPIPKGDEARANPSVRPVGMTMPMQAVQLALDESLKNGVATKDRYGRLPHKVIVNCIGIRSDESNPRSRLTPLSRNQGLSTRSRTVYNWLPVFDQTLSGVLAWHWVNAIRLHPVYVPEYHKDGTTGGYLRRFSCRVCIFSTDADLVAIHLHDRAAFDAVVDLERKMNFTMRPGASLVQIVEAHSSTNIEEARQQSFCF